MLILRCLSLATPLGPVPGSPSSGFPVAESGLALEVLAWLVWLLTVLWEAGP